MTPLPANVWQIEWNSGNKLGVSDKLSFPPGIGDALFERLQGNWVFVAIIPRELPELLRMRSVIFGIRVALTKFLLSA